MASRTNLETADHIVHVAQSAAARLGVSVCVAVADQAGDLVVLSRMDGASPAAVAVCQAKAETARLFQARTADLVGLPATVPAAFARPIALFGGGVLLHIDGSPVGSLGVSGASEADDVLIADEAAAAMLAT